MSTSTLQPIDTLALWAKTHRTRDGIKTYHPLLCHLLDVGAVAVLMWDEVVPMASKRQFATGLGLADVEVAGRWAVFLAASHDLGKASFFAGKDRDVRDRLLADGWRFPSDELSAPHGEVSMHALRDLLASVGVASPVANSLAAAVGGHHGEIRKYRRRLPNALGGGRWVEARRQLFDILAAAFDLPDPRPTEASPAAGLWLAGLVSVADWIGSNRRFFRFADADELRKSADAAEAYLPRARRSAREALQKLGWLATIPYVGDASYGSIGVTHPNAMQSAVAEIAAKVDGPGLVIVEAPMGEGKTEAALFLAEHWARQQGLRGHYFALPTQATSNGMFGRVRKMLAERSNQGTVNLQLLHGHASLSAEFEVLRLAGDELFAPSDVDSDDLKTFDGASHAIVAAEWFTHKKRGLLAPLGVGTIDQSLLGALRARHVFVRLFGMAGKTVIVDEAHAYDAYMTSLLERLLVWLAALGTPVVILSATLPQERRDRLIGAYREGLNVVPRPVPAARYPRITWATRDQMDAAHVEVSDRAKKRVAVEYRDDDLAEPRSDQLIADLVRALDSGGCAAIVCNTVSRAQRTYRRLRHGLRPQVESGWIEVDLFHARFPFAERDRREVNTLVRFGKACGTVVTSTGDKPVDRPKRAILVGSPVIESSLDIDFDLMVSDLAPVDLLLQRLGRLHRHPRGDRGTPTLWLRRPAGERDRPIFDSGSRRIYDEHILLRSWIAVRELGGAISIPDDVDGLIGAVYATRAPEDSLPPELRRAWSETADALRAKIEADAAEAGKRWILHVADVETLASVAADPREEDAPTLHQEFQALTRLAEPSISVVLLGPGEHVDLETRRKGNRLTTDEVKELLGRAVTLQDRRVIGGIAAAPAPPVFTASPLLRHHRLLRMNDRRSVDVRGGHTLTDDPEVGIVVDDLKEE